MDTTTPGTPRERSERQGERPVRTCADCGDPVRLPFKPRANRLVYCTPCHRARNEAQRAVNTGRSRGLRGPALPLSQRGWDPEGPPPPPPLPRIGLGRAGSYE